MSPDSRDLNELRELWQSQPLSPGAPSGNDLVERVRARARRHDRAIVWRNVQEAAAGGLLVVVMGWTSWLAPGWPPKVGAAVGIAGVIFVLGKLALWRRANPPVPCDLTLSAWLKAELHKAEANIRLLKSVGSWYIAPLFAGATVWSGILVTTGLASLPLSRTRLALALGACAAISGLVLAVVGWAVWKLNRHAVATHLEPYARELRSLLDDIQSADEAGVE
jgi:hypothetical protein